RRAQKRGPNAPVDIGPRAKMTKRWRPLDKMTRGDPQSGPTIVVLKRETANSVRRLAATTF
ncbi:MAG: hypothetical protein AAGE52_22140, partial [Myxococcota bacterium]